MKRSDDDLTIKLSMDLKYLGEKIDERDEKFAPISPPFTTRAGPGVVAEPDALKAKPKPRGTETRFG